MKLYLDFYSTSHFFIKFLKIDLDFCSEEPNMFFLLLYKYYIVKNELEGGTVKQKRSH
jgi:hypothetical protein